MKGAGSFAVGRTEFLGGIEVGAGAGKASEKVAFGHTPRGSEGGSTVGIPGGRGGQCEGPGAGRSLVSWAPQGSQVAEPRGRREVGAVDIGGGPEFSSQPWEVLWRVVNREMTASHVHLAPGSDG